MKINLRLSIALIVCSFALNAWSQQNFHKQNFAEMYKLNERELHPEFQCFHQDDSTSLLFYQVDLSELKYKLNKDSVHAAHAKIHYRIYYNYKAKELVDSGSFYLIDTENYLLDNSSIGYLELALAQGNQYVVFIEFTDKHSGYSLKTLLDVDKQDYLSRQNFYIRGIDQLPFLQYHVNRNQEFQLISRSEKQEEIIVRYFEPNTKIARPPMLAPEKSTRKVLTDSLYKMSFKEGYSHILELEKQGYYHFHIDSTQSQGITLFSFTKNYPYISTPMQMIMPLRYITNRSEFKALFNSEDKKKAVDKFWLDISGNKSRAKNMIKLYYNRVQNANICFTSDKEGWMTDRGMIYIVFGAPDVVFRDQEMETWKYGNNQSKKSIVFNFYKIDNPFSSEDFALDRDPSYNIHWNNAIEIWRR